MNENGWRHQVSFKFGPAGAGHMWNVRGETQEELEHELRKAQNSIGTAVMVAEVLRTESVGGQPANSGVAPQGHAQPAPVQQPAQPVNGPAPQWTQPPNSNPSQWTPPGGAPACAHGSMILKSGEKNGKRWSGWFCSGAEGQPRCAVQWVND